MKTIRFASAKLSRFHVLNLLFLAAIFSNRAEPARHTPLTREFCGSTPCGTPIRKLLALPNEGDPELIQWKLILHLDPATREPARYELRCEYGRTVPNQPGLGAAIKTLEKKGACKIVQGADINGVIYQLSGSLALREVNSNILQILNSDRSLMAGNGGWSYTLNSTSHSEGAVEPALARNVPDMSYPISPRTTNETVFGVFEGRTPCLGIARELQISVPASATKAKWRISLYHDPQTFAPTSYKIEGTLFRRAAREGSWAITRGAQHDPGATVYQLHSNSGPDLFLMKGDDNVLFFLDHDRNLMVGHCEFSYTLNRVTQGSLRSESASVP